MEIVVPLVLVKGDVSMCYNIDKDTIQSSSITNHIPTLHFITCPMSEEIAGTCDGHKKRCEDVNKN